jgi:hypothetical protein
MARYLLVGQVWVTTEVLPTAQPPFSMGQELPVVLGCRVDRLLQFAFGTPQKLLGPLAVSGHVVVGAVDREDYSPAALAIVRAYSPRPEQKRPPQPTVPQGDGPLPPRT